MECQKIRPRRTKTKIIECVFESEFHEIGHRAQECARKTHTRGLLGTRCSTKYFILTSNSYTTRSIPFFSHQYLMCIFLKYCKFTYFHSQSFSFLLPGIGTYERQQRLLHFLLLGSLIWWRDIFIHLYFGVFIFTQNFESIHHNMFVQFMQKVRTTDQKFFSNFQLWCTLFHMGKCIILTITTLVYDTRIRYHDV